MVHSPDSSRQIAFGSRLRTALLSTALAVNRIGNFTFRLGEQPAANETRKLLGLGCERDGD